MLPRTTPAVLLLVGLIGCTNGEGLPSGPSPGGPASNPPGLLGAYRLTFTAAPSCTLPPEASNVTFAAWVWEPTPGSIRVDVQTNFECWGCSPGFTGTRDGDTVHFVIVGGPPGDGTVVEVFGPGKEVRYEGEGLATFGEGTITGTFSGLIEASDGVALADCRATDHRMVFVLVR